MSVEYELHGDFYSLMIFNMWVFETPDSEFGIENNDYAQLQSVFLSFMISFFLFIIHLAFIC